MAEPLGPARAKPPVFTAFLLLAVIVLSVLVVVLLRQNRELRQKALAAEQALTREQTRDSLAVGEAVGALTLVDSAGAERLVSFVGTRPTLLLLISGHCSYCEETIPVWRRILEQTEAVKAGRVAVECVQIDARVSGDLKRMAFPVEPVLAKAEATTWLRRVPIAPGAVLVGPDGVVKKVWFGVPSDRDQRELESALLGG